MDNELGHIAQQRNEITAAIPQGSPFGPTLFDVYINDIPKRDISNCSGLLLYADDLATMFMYDKRGHIEQTINKYLLNK
jgi:hypothetical protein